ncbi:MAG: hypothetical protein FJ298_15945 [Planctomycetes bacterium]|nr:hypothetical protein [Planctomycetota bacterium]
MPYSTNWKPTVPLAGTQPIAENSTTPQHPLGTVIQAVDAGSNANGMGEFVYLKGVASTVVGSFVLYSEDDYGTSLLAPNDIGQVAIAMSACVASQFGWYQIKGKAVGKVLAAFADNGNVYGTATAGSVDDAVVAGDRVKKCRGASAIDFPATGLAEFEIDRPFVDDALAA